MTQPPEPKKRRSCLGSFCMSGVGCVSFGLGALVILILLLPRMVGPWVAGEAARGFGRSFEGSVEVEDVELAWTGRQRVDDVRLLDPDGSEVGRATLELPSILDLFSEGTKTIEIELEADLSADDEGATNLERALAPRPGVKVTSGDGDEPTDEDLRELEQLDLALVVRGRRISWSDASTRARGAPYVVRDLELTVRLAPGQPKTLDLDARLEGGEPTPLRLDAVYPGKVGDLARGDLTGLAIDAEAKGLSMALVDAVAGQGGALLEVFGPTVDVAVHVTDPLGDAGRASVELTGDSRHLTFAGGMEGGAFLLDEDVPLSAALGLPLQRAIELAEGALPEGAALLAGESTGPATLDAYNLVVPPESIAAFREGRPVEGLRGVRGHLVAELPAGVYYSDPTTDARGLILGLTSAHLEVQSEGEGDPLRGSLYASIDTGVPGDVEVSFKLGRPGTTEPDLSYFDLQVRQVSGSAVDGYLELDGCFVEAVGETFGFRAEGDGLTRETGELMAYVRSTGFSGNVHGHVEDGVLLLDPEHGLNATLRPAPGWFERCIAREVPGGWSVNLLRDPDEGLRFLTDGTAFPLPAEWTAEGVLDALSRGTGKMAFELATVRLARTSGDVEQLVGFEDIRVAAEMSDEGTLDVALESGLYTGAAGTFSLHAVVPDAAATLRGGDARGVELDVGATGVSEELLREALAPFLPEGATLSIDAEEEVRLRWKGGFRRDGLDALDALSGDATLTLGGVSYSSGATEAGDELVLGLDDVEATVALGGEDLALTLAATPAPGTAAELLGERLRVDARLLGPGADTGAGGVEASLEAPRLSARGTARLEGGAVSVAADAPLEVTWRPSETGLRDLLATSLAPGQTLAGRDGAAIEVRVTASDVRLPLEDDADASGDEAPDESLFARLATLRAHVELATTPLVLRDGATSRSAELGALRGTLDVRPGEAPTLELVADGGADANADASAGAPLRVHARALAPFAAGVEPRAELDVRGTGLPTPLIDALGRAEGLVADVFGPRVDLVLTSPGIGPRNGSFRAELTSPTATTTFTGELTDGVLTTTEGEGLDASVGLTPLFSKRIVGPLLPLVVDVEKPEGTDPCGLAVRDIAFPLDGDLSQLDAVVELDLGQVAYRLLPGLEREFLSDLTKVRVRDVRPLTVRIKKGVAHYDGLPIEIGGRDLGFRGSFGLADRRLSFAADVPLAVLGDDVARKARELAGGELAVPLTVSGTTARPSLKVDLEGVLKEAAGSALQRLLRGDR